MLQRDSKLRKFKSYISDLNEAHVIPAVASSP